MFAHSLILFFIFMSVGCGNYSRQLSPSASTIPSAGNTGLGEGQPKNKIDFAQIKESFLQKQCIECHTGEHTLFSQYSQVRASAGAILASIQSGSMPKGGPRLSAEQIQLFSDWVAAGAPETVADDDEDEDNTGVGEPVEPLNISFQEISDRVLKPYNCVGCHSQYKDYGVVRRSVVSIASLINNGKMPFPKKKGQEVTPVAKEDFELLLKWIEQDAPEFSTGESEVPEVPEMQPNFISLRNQVLGPKCILCHNSFGPRGPGAMDTYTNIRNWFTKKPELFDFKDPENSHFVGAILGRVDDDEFYFDPMPYNTPADDVSAVIAPITEKELDMIKKWIELKLPLNMEDQ